MDKFITHAGQQPIFLGDIDFFDKAVRETFARTVKAMTFGNENMILQGCEYTEDVDGDYLTVSWTSGIVMIQGEILPIDAGSASGNASFLAFIVTQTYDAAGRRMMKTGTEIDCFEIRKATIVEYLSTPSGPYCPFVSMKRFDDILEERILSVANPKEISLVNKFRDQYTRIYPGESRFTFMNFRLYKNGDSFYIYGSFSLAGGAHDIGTLYKTTVARTDITSEDREKLLSKNHVTTIPAYIDISADSSDDLEIEIKTCYELSTTSLGCFFTRLNIF